MSRKSITEVLEVLEVVDAAGLNWDAISQFPEAEVHTLVFRGRGEHHSVFAQPDWGRNHKEIARVVVTLKLLHGEYADSCAVARDPATGYDRICRTNQRRGRITGASSRVGHKAGQTGEVDWSGPTIQLAGPASGTTTIVYLFVGCLPVSRYAFVEPTLDMKQDTWLRAHVAMFEAFTGSVPRIVPDNLKTGVIKHPREGEIVLKDAYREMAAHYSAAVLPGRVKAPKDKASVESTVWHATMRTRADLRQTRFTTLPELKSAITERVEGYSGEPFQKRPGSRASVFAEKNSPC